MRSSRSAWLLQFKLVDTGSICMLRLTGYLHLCRFARCIYLRVHGLVSAFYFHSHVLGFPMYISMDCESEQHFFNVCSTSFANQHSDAVLQYCGVAL